MNGFLIAAPHSGSGKTTLTLGILAALSRRGKKVAAFKCGPDFIDPGYHSLATGRPSINLDAWMCPAAFVEETFRHHSSQADIAVIEGVMGLFDGMGASPMDGSSAQIAAITATPVVLVVNVRGMAASAAALVKGFAEFDPQVKVTGVIFNGVGSSNHRELLTKAVENALPDVKVLGCMPKDDALKIPSRHLGLVTAEENPLPPAYLDHLIALCEEHLDMDALSRLETVATPEALSSAGLGIITSQQSEGPNTALQPVRIAVARDNAFCFVYEDNLRLLRQAGAKLVEFSPLADASLPDGISGIYLPGGYPELYVAQLAGNLPMKAAIRDAVKAGMPVYAECGGFIYLTQGMEPTDSSNPAEDFVGIYPVRANMLPKRKALGYRQVELTGDTVIAANGETARGHEFHYSEINDMPASIPRCYRMTRQERFLGAEGYQVANCLASYVHLHFGSNSNIAASFHEACCNFLRCKTP